MSDRRFDATFNYENYPSIDQRPNYPVAPASRSAKDATSTLYDLKKMYDDGIITAEEYELKRRKMLDDI